MRWPWQKISEEPITSREIYVAGKLGVPSVTFSAKLNRPTTEWLAGLALECGIPRSTVVREILIWARAELFVHWDGTLGLRQFLSRLTVERKP